MAYAEVSDVEARLSRQLNDMERGVIDTLLEDAAIIIDAFAQDASEAVKSLVSCRMVSRMVGTDDSYPVGAMQGSMSGLGYAQSWTIGSGGSNGELYLSKVDKQLLGRGSSIGSYSPVEGLVITCAE